MSTQPTSPITAACSDCGTQAIFPDPTINDIKCNWCGAQRMEEIAGFDVVANLQAENSRLREALIEAELWIRWGETPRYASKQELLEYLAALNSNAPDGSQRRYTLQEIKDTFFPNKTWEELGIKRDKTEFLPYEDTGE